MFQHINCDAIHNSPYERRKALDKNTNYSINPFETQISEKLQLDSNRVITQRNNFRLKKMLFWETCNHVKNMS